jgi:hypothetical protein
LCFSVYRFFADFNGTRVEWIHWALAVWKPKKSPSFSILKIISRSNFVSSNDPVQVPTGMHPEFFLNFKIILLNPVL